MALKIFDKFAPRANPADSNYPYGSIKNESIPGAKDGTPLDASWGNDMLGFTDALLTDAGITPSGAADTAIASQRLDALKTVSSLQAAILLIEQWGYTYKGTFAKGFTYSQVGDVGVDVDFNMWVYVGAGAPNKSVSAGTVPSVGEGYEKVTFNKNQKIHAAVARMVSDLTLSEGFKVFVSERGGTFKVTSSSIADGWCVIQLDNGLFANLEPVNNQIMSSWAGAREGVDSREPIQSALNYTRNMGVEYVNDGDYLISTIPVDLFGNTYNIGLSIGSGVRYIENGSVRIIPNSHENYYIFNFYGADGFHMKDPVAIGDRDDHLGTGGEWGHCFNLTGCSNGVLIDPVAKKAWGDGFYIGKEYLVSGSFNPDNIKLIRPRTEDCSRNGISWVGGTNILIDHPVNLRVDRIAPQAGIDLEPEHGRDSVVLSGEIISPVSANCGTGFNSFLNKGSVDVVISGHGKDTGSTNGFSHRAVLPDSTLKGRLVVDNFYTEYNGKAGLLVENLEDVVSFKMKGKAYNTNRAPSSEELNQGAMVIFNTFGNNATVGSMDIELEVVEDTNERIIPNPIHTVRQSSVVSQMVNSRINLSKVIGTVSASISSYFGIDSSTSVIYKIRSNSPPSGYFSEWEMVGATTNNVLNTGSSQLNNGAGIKCTHLSEGAVNLQVNRPSDGSKMFLNGVDSASVNSSVMGSSIVIRPISQFSFAICDLSGTWA